jgi:hypothetical protein
LAAVEIDKVEKVQDQLAALAPAVPDAKSLMDDARRRLKLAWDLWERQQYREAYQESKRAVRPVRILMRAQWESASKSFGPEAPVTASPYAVSFYTLPKHWKFRSELERCSPGGNVINDGDFERADQIPDGWQIRQGIPDELEADAGVSTLGPHDGRHCLKLQIRPKTVSSDGQLPAAIEPAYLGVTTAPAAFAAGTLVRVSAWVKIDKPIVGSAVGALFFDFGGGAPVGVRLTCGQPGGMHFPLYRRVPANGQIQITAALTGLGTVYFDDLKIEPLNPR